MKYALFATFIALALAGCATVGDVDTRSARTGSSADGFATPAAQRAYDDQNPGRGCGAGAEGLCPPWLEWPR